MYAAHRLMFPFPALWTATSPPSELLQILQPHEDLFAFIDSFTRMGQGFVFPYLPEELTKKEVQHFLQDAEQNANKHPDYLALIFAASALGEQLSCLEQMSKQGKPQAQNRKSGVFGKTYTIYGIYIADGRSRRGDARSSFFFFLESTYAYKHPSFVDDGSIPYQQWEISRRLGIIGHNHPFSTRGWPSS